MSKVGGITVLYGDSREVLRQFSDGHFDSVVTDPPYALVSIVKRFANSPRNEKTENQANPYGRTGRGFMGQKWDTGETAFSSDFWAEVLRVLKPGGHVVAFSGTRTYHRMACAVEDAGFEIRDQIGWAFGSGFPKSHNIGKAIDKAAGLVRPRVRGGCGAQGTITTKGMKPGEAISGEAATWSGWGTALKPAWEPICLARKPLSEKTVAANVLRWGTGAINIEGCRVEYESDLDFEAAKGGDSGSNRHAVYGGFKQAIPQSAKIKRTGRWPANIIHDGSDEVAALFPQSDGQQGDVRGTEPSRVTSGIYGEFGGRVPAPTRNDSGSAARFFYTAKADAGDRIGSKHPTVKPVDLMQWLVRLITPPGGLVLDPFAGSGTTGEAAFREGMRCVMIEREAPFVADIERRIGLLLAGPDERANSAVKAKIADGRVPDDAGPLFKESV